MPLESGKSKGAFAHNVKAEIAAGKPQKQAVAIAYAKARDSEESELRKAIASGKQELKHQEAALAEIEDVDCSADEDPEIDCAMDEAGPALVFDRALHRTKDEFGRLHVTDCRISKSNICPYLGREIPGWQQLGLDGDRVYQMYRDPAALRVGAPTAERIPLMMYHIGSTADQPRKEVIVGCVSNIRWKKPYLVGDITVWDQAGIDAVESGRQQELSPGYLYEPDMTSGHVGDERFDGWMRGPIKFNHLALVDTGRTGPDVYVHDTAT